MSLISFPNMAPANFERSLLLGQALSSNSIYEFTFPMFLIIFVSVICSSSLGINLNSKLPGYCTPLKRD